MTKNHQAFLDLALPHLDVIWSLARRLAAFPLEPEDLVQDTYLRAFASFDSYRGGDARSWLVSICLNTARSHGRRRSLIGRQIVVQVRQPGMVSQAMMGRKAPQPPVYTTVAP